MEERMKGREKRMRIRYRKQTVWRMREEERVRVEYERSSSARLKEWGRIRRTRVRAKFRDRG